MGDYEIKAYTLIELLVVMTIVALLSGISIFALQGSRGSGRDGQRRADLETIRSALELYKSDCGAYPVNLPAAGSSLTSNAAGGLTPPSTARTYHNNIPGDPTGGNYTYNRTSNFVYELCATLEEPPATPQSCGGVGNYRVTNP